MLKLQSDNFKTETFEERSKTSLVVYTTAAFGKTVETVAL